MESGGASGKRSDVKYVFCVGGLGRSDELKCSKDAQRSAGCRIKPGKGLVLRTRHDALRRSPAAVSIAWSADDVTAKVGSETPASPRLVRLKAAHDGF